MYGFFEASEVKYKSVVVDGIDGAPKREFEDCNLLGYSRYGKYGYTVPELNDGLPVNVYLFDTGKGGAVAVLNLACVF